MQLYPRLWTVDNNTTCRNRSELYILRPPAGNLRTLLPCNNCRRYSTAGSYIESVLITTHHGNKGICDLKTSACITWSVQLINIKYHYALPKNKFKMLKLLLTRKHIAYVTWFYYSILPKDLIKKASKRNYAIPGATTCTYSLLYSTSKFCFRFVNQIFISCAVSIELPVTMQYPSIPIDNTITCTSTFVDWYDFTTQNVCEHQPEYAYI